MKISWNSVSTEFERDGSLRDIYVSPATIADWQRSAAFLRQHATDVSYSLDGEPLPLPASIAEAFSARAHAAPLLTFRFGLIYFATHFFNDDEVEFDISPNDLSGQSDLDTLLDFTQRLGDLLAKPVSITHENCPEHAFLVYQPDSSEFIYRLASVQRAS